MAARKTPSRGSKPDKLMRDALMLALKREAKDDRGKKTTKLANIARKLVDLAEGGDVQAIKEVADRVDGRPAQVLAGDPAAPLFSVGEAQKTLDEKLARIVAADAPGGPAC